jgi:hypothetical protein
MGFSEDMPMCIIELAIRNASKFTNCVYGWVQMIYNVSKYVLKIFSFISETISMIYRDIKALRSIIPQKVYVQIDGSAGEWSEKGQVSEHLDGIIVFMHCHAATNEKPKVFPGIVIGYHKMIRE